MQERIITLATPAFFALIAIELLWGLMRRRNTYRINDTLAAYRSLAPARSSGLRAT